MQDQEIEEKNLVALEIILTDLKNDFESGALNDQQKLLSVNNALRDLSLLKDDDINESIAIYRAQQKELEDAMNKSYMEIVSNMNLMYSELIKFLG